MCMPAEHEIIVVAHNALAGAYAACGFKDDLKHHLFAQCYVDDMTPANIFLGFPNDSAWMPRQVLMLQPLQNVL